MSNDQLLTKREVAKKLRVSESTIDDYRKRGSLTAYKVGKKILFYESQLTKAIQPENRGGK